MPRTIVAPSPSSSVLRGGYSSELGTTDSNVNFGPGGNKKKRGCEPLDVLQPADAPDQDNSRCSPISAPTTTAPTPAVAMAEPGDGKPLGAGVDVGGAGKWLCHVDVFVQ